MTHGHAVCARIDEFLDAYVDGELASVAAISERDVIAHLVACTTCLEHVLMVRELKNVIRRCGPPVAPPEVRSRVVTRIYESESTVRSSWSADWNWGE